MNNYWLAGWFMMVYLMKMCMG